MESDSRIIKNINARAQHFLKDHLMMLGKHYNQFEYMNDKYYLEFENDDYMRIGYKEGKKFLSVIFAMEVQHIMTTDIFNESFFVKVRFSGTTDAEGAFFINDTSQKAKSFRRSKPISEKLLKTINDPKMINAIVRFAKKVDLESIKISYNERNCSLKISIVPMAGSYMWLKFPPVFYKIPLRDDEMKELYRFSMTLRELALAAWARTA